MRTSLLLAAALVAVLSGQALAGDDGASCGVSDYTLGSCDSCGGHGLRLHGLRCGHGCGGLGCGHHHRNRYEGRDLGFNCGCQGSYNYPVPPQYTYHWPGSTYKQRLMTDYHSPWRFPPIKPYTDETLVPAGAGVSTEETLRPVAAYQDLQAPPVPAGQIESMSSMMERFFR